VGWGGGLDVGFGRREDDEVASSPPPLLWFLKNTGPHITTTTEPPGGRQVSPPGRLPALPRGADSAHRLSTHSSRGGRSGATAAAGRAAGGLAGGAAHAAAAAAGIGFGMSPRRVGRCMEGGAVSPLTTIACVCVFKSLHCSCSVRLCYDMPTIGCACIMSTHTHTELHALPPSNQHCLPHC